MKILIDTNIVLDVALERQPYLIFSEQILLNVEQGKLVGYISASTFTDLYYIIRKERGRAWALEFLNQLLMFCKIATVDHAVISRALTASFSDLEDVVQYETAIAAQLDAIVTRNPNDFPSKELKILTPEMLLQGLSSSESQST